MEPGTMFELAAAAIAVAEAYGEYLESGRVDDFDVDEAFKEYQHLRDRGD